MEQLIIKNRGLIGLAIRDLHCIITSYEDYQEIYDAGMLGLINGAKNYDGSVKESTYLYACIKNEIVRLFSDRTRAKRIPRKLIYSLDYQYEDGKLEDTIAADINLEDDIIKQETINDVRIVISRIKPKYQELLKRHFGIDYKAHTLKELAKMHNCSYQNICRAYNVAKKHFIREWCKYENHRCKK